MVDTAVGLKPLAMSRLEGMGHGTQVLTVTTRWQW